MAAPTIQQGFQVLLAGLRAPFERMAVGGMSAAATQPGQRPHHDGPEGVLAGPLPSSCHGECLVGLPRCGGVEAGHGLMLGP